MDKPKNVAELLQYAHMTEKTDGEHKTFRAIVYIASLFRLLNRHEQIAFLNRGELDLSADVSNKWAGLIAGIFEREARIASIPLMHCEGFYKDEYYVQPWWFLVQGEQWVPYLLQYSPPELKSKGVFVDESSLECL